MSTYPRHSFDENEEWDKILQDLNIPTKTTLQIANAKARAEAEVKERKVIEDTEEWNEVQELLDMARESQRRHLEEETTQIALLEQQRQIVLRAHENQKIAEAVQKSNSEEQNYTEEDLERNMETKMTPQPVYALNHSNAVFSGSEKADLSKSFYRSDDEFSNIQERQYVTDEHIGRAEPQKLEDTVSESDFLDFEPKNGGVLFPVITKCKIPGCGQCAALRANIKLEIPDGVIGLDGHRIIPVITAPLNNNKGDSDSSSDSDGGVMLTPIDDPFHKGSDLNPNGRLSPPKKSLFTFELEATEHKISEVH